MHARAGNIVGETESRYSSNKPSPQEAWSEASLSADIPARGVPFARNDTSVAVGPPTNVSSTTSLGPVHRVSKNSVVNSHELSRHRTSEPEDLALSGKHVKAVVHSQPAVEAKEYINNQRRTAPLVQIDQAPRPNSASKAPLQIFAPEKSPRNLRPSSPVTVERLSPFSTPSGSDDGLPEPLLPSSATLTRGVEKDNLPEQQPGHLLQSAAASDHCPLPNSTVAVAAGRRIPNRPHQRLAQSPHVSVASIHKYGPGAERHTQIAPSLRKAPPPPPRRKNQSKPLQELVLTASTDNNSSSNTHPIAQSSNDPSKAKCADGFPEISRVNRNPPHSLQGARPFHVGDDIRLVDICEQFVCTAASTLQVFDIVTGESILSIPAPEKEVKFSAIAFKPATATGGEGSFLWSGTESGQLFEVDIANRQSTCSTARPHERRTIVKIHRHQNAMWTIDERGRLCVWKADETGLPNIQANAEVLSVNKGYTCSVIVHDSLWIGHGKEIHVCVPRKLDTSVTRTVDTSLSQAKAGVITSATVIGGRPNEVYFGHADGKVSIYDVDTLVCVRLVTIGSHKITSLLGVGSTLWASLNTGSVSTYNVDASPWIMQKSWMAHRGHAVLNLAMDLGGLWRSGHLRVVSCGADHTVRVWDGALRNDWQGKAQLLEE